MVLILSLLGCLGGHAPVRALAPTPIDVVPVLGNLESAAVADAPERFDEALLDALASRNLQPNLLAPERYVEAFSTRRDTTRRLEVVAGPDALLLVETDAAFYSQISGRYRWTVSVTLTLVPAGLTETFEVPVFLQFHHEREAEALAAATPVIVRCAGDLVDGWLAGEQAGR